MLPVRVAKLAAPVPPAFGRLARKARCSRSNKKTAREPAHAWRPAGGRRYSVAPAFSRLARDARCSRPNQEERA